MVRRSQPFHWNTQDLMREIMVLTSGMNPVEAMEEARRIKNINYNVGYRDPEGSRKRKLRNPTLTDRLSSDPMNLTLTQPGIDNFKARYAGYLEAYRQAWDFLKDVRHVEFIVALNMDTSEYTIFKGDEELRRFRDIFALQLRPELHPLDANGNHMFFYCTNEAEVLLALEVIQRVGDHEAIPIGYDDAPKSLKIPKTGVTSTRHPEIVTHSEIEKESKKNAGIQQPLGAPQGQMVQPSSDIRVSHRKYPGRKRRRLEKTGKEVSPPKTVIPEKFKITGGTVVPLVSPGLSPIHKKLPPIQLTPEQKKKISESTIEYIGEPMELATPRSAKKR